MELTSKQKRHLRALAHHLDPVVLIGTSGVTDAVIAKVAAELDNHELIKVKVAKDAPVKVDDAAPAICGHTGAAVAQIIGHTMVLYRARKKKPEIKLPE